jgi:hypothetical protein
LLPRAFCSPFPHGNNAPRKHPRNTGPLRDIHTSGETHDSADIRLPAATDWRTSDQDEINRRILRAREEKFAIRNLTPRHPVFSDFEVQSQSGMTYTVEIHSVAEREFHCD